jgi:uncharacterized protein YdgA (DUF945 family)
MEGIFYMADFIVKYWALFSSCALILIWITAWLIRLHWRVSKIELNAPGCEARCKERVETLKTEYNNDLKEMKADLKESMKLTQNMNISLTSLVSYLQGKGITPPTGP